MTKRKENPAFTSTPLKIYQLEMAKTDGNFTEKYEIPSQSPRIDNFGSLLFCVEAHACIDIKTFPTN